MVNDIQLRDEKELQLSEKQKAIYHELSQIGPEIAAFYVDGLKIIADAQFQTRVNLLAHVYREIDGGIRDILATKSTIDNKKTLTAEEIDHYSTKGGQEAKSEFAQINQRTKSSPSMQFLGEIRENWANGMLLLRLALP